MWHINKQKIHTIRQNNRQDIAKARSPNTIGWYPSYPRSDNYRPATRNYFLMINNHSTFLTQHVEILRASYAHWTGESDFDEAIGQKNAVEALFAAPFAVLSHGIGTDPIFNYGNQLALDLFEMSWEEFTALPSRLSAEVINQEERAKLLATVTQNGYINNYSGIRIAKSGRRFIIRNATVWNLLTPDGQYYGQAALIRNYEYL